MGIKDMISNWKSKSAKYKEYEEERHIEEKYLERKKSANERELERYAKEAREKVIKAELEKFRNAEKEEFTEGHQILAVRNVFKEKDTPKILAAKNIILRKQKGLFFK